MAQPRVIDADGHVMEFTINWKEVLPEPLGQKALWAMQQGSRVYWPEPIVRETEGPMGPWHQDPERSGMWDPHRRMKDMDLEGIDVAVLFGGGTGLGVSGLQDRRLAAGMARGITIGWRSTARHTPTGSRALRRSRCKTYRLRWKS